MPAGTQTGANTAAVWTDLTKLAPMVWLKGAMASIQDVQPVMDLYMVDQLDQYNRDYGSIASSGFGKVILNDGDYDVRVNNQADTLSATVRKRGDAFSVSEDLIDGNKYSEIGLGLEDLGGSLFRTRARDATHVPFTFGFSSSFTDAEGNSVTNAVAKGSEPVFDDTHTMADASTFDNELANTPIGETALRDLYNLAPTFKDENGQKVPWGKNIEKILITGDDVPMNQTAERLTTQDWIFNSANRDKSVYKGKFRHLPLFYLDSLASGKADTTKAKYYFIIDPNIMGRIAIFSDHTKPLPEGPFDDMFNGGKFWRSKTRYDIGIQAAHLGAGCPATT